MTGISLEARRERVQKYFVPLPKRPIRAHIKLGAAIVVLLVGLISGEGILDFVAFAILIWAGVGYIRYMRERARALPRATDAQMDDWLDSRIPSIVDDGKARLNVHPTELGPAEDRNWLSFIGIPAEDEVPYLRARGQDGNLRFSVYKVMIIYLSNWRLPVYESYLHMETGATVADSTKEYNLNQVDGMETVSDRVAMPGPASNNQQGGQIQAGATTHFTRHQLVNLVVSGRPAVSLIIGIADGDVLHTEGVSQSRIDEGIATLREYLRSHHHGTQREELGLSDGPPGLAGPPGLGLQPPPELPR